MNRQYVTKGLFFVLPCLLITFVLLSREKNEFYYEIHVVQRDISLEPIVAQLTNCTDHDRARQYSLLRILRAWSIFATEHRLVYWLAYGSLVGYVQRGGLLPHDKDVDVEIPWEQTTQLEILARKNFSDDFYLVVQPLWRRPYYATRKHFRSRGVHFVAPNARLYDRKEDHYLDIWASYERMPNITNRSLSSIDKGMFVDYDISYQFMENPRDWVYPLQKCEFSGIPVWCPAKPEKFVARVYGEKALNTSDTVCRNGTWQ